MLHEPQTALRNNKGQFLQGSTGNAAGRPKGSRNRLGEVFLEALYADFVANGAEAITEARLTDPCGYLRLIASLVPKQLPSERGGVAEMSDEELEQCIREFRQCAAYLASGEASPVGALEEPLAQ